MKAVLTSALAVGLCVVAFAQDKKADPVGTWKCEYEIGDMKRTSTLTIKKDGDKLAGTMSWPNQKETELKDLKLKDSDLTFSAERVAMDDKYHVEYKFTITGDSLMRAPVQRGSRRARRTTPAAARPVLRGLTTT